MDTINTILSRKSVRSYTGEKISENDLNTILKSAYASPVGLGKYDSIHLTVVENQELLQSIDIAATKLFGKPDMHPLYGAPTLVIVSSTISDVNLSNVAYSNAAIMVHNMALTAVELGIGSCYIWGAMAAINAESSLVKQLNLPDDFIPCCGIILGKSNVEYSLRNIPDNRVGTNFSK
jgi:nitroreductase